ncbi:hypothetical protein B566_EDAN001276 [Ephemera danica]|nr:hypothetical protein B566_EDAN001276 [Ephemera danica]
MKLKRIQIDTWSTREQLCLASSVLRSGDQNWVSVSRAVKVLGDQGRPHDWFSQKNCALQYDSLLENAGTPKRKRGEKGEEAKPTTPGECIVQKLTMERIDELKRLLAHEKERYRKLKEDVIELSSGRADHRLGEISQQIEEEKKQKELEQIAHERRLKEREEKISEIQRAFRPQSYLIQRKAAVPVRPPGPVEMPVNSDTEMSQDSPLTDSPNVEPVLPEETPVKTEEKPASTPTSPLLTSLLKSPSPAPSAQASILHSAITAQRVPVASTASATPTISSLLAASPAKREGAVVASAPASSFSPGLSHLVTSAISSGAAEVLQAPEDQARAQTVPSTSPSAGAPTLSMLLELPPSVPGTPLPELPKQTLASGATDEELLVADQMQKQMKTEVVQTESIPCQDGIIVEQNILQAGPTLPISTVANVLPVNTVPTGQLLELKPEAPAEERPTTQVESVLEELPQDVVSLIEEVEMAEEAQKQLQLQQQQQQPTPAPPKEQPQPDDVKLKIQEIQQQLVASTPEVVEVVPEPETIPKQPVAEVESASELPTITEEAEEPEPAVEIQKELQPEPQEKEEAVADEVQEVKTEEEEKTVEPTAEPQEPDLEEQGTVDEVEPESTVPAESIPDEVEISPESQDVTEEEDEVQAEEQVTMEAVIKEDEDIAEKEAVPASPKQPVIQIMEEVAVKQEVEQEAEEEEEDEEEPPPQQQQTLSTPVTTRRRHAPPASTPSTPIDSLPNSPASVGISATDEDREYRAWKKTILPLWSQLAAHKNASIFTRPITNEMAPGYHNVVFRPMDLTTIKKNIETGQIRSTIEFQRDLMLMFTNAIMYNASNHEVPKMAQEMQKDCLNTLQFLTAHEPAGIVGPLRRERRETNKRHDSSYLGDGDDSEASRSTAPSPLPLKRKRIAATAGTPAETKKRRSSIVP